jgi:hypothetical protein
MSSVIKRETSSAFKPAESSGVHSAARLCAGEAVNRGPMVTSKQVEHRRNLGALVAFAANLGERGAVGRSLGGRNCGGRNPNPQPAQTFSHGEDPPRSAKILS